MEERKRWNGLRGNLEKKRRIRVNRREKGS